MVAAYSSSMDRFRWARRLHEAKPGTRPDALRHAGVDLTRTTFV